VVVEASSVEMCMEDSAMGTVRAIYWHDFNRFRTVLRSILETKFRGGGNYFYRHILWPLDAIRYDADVFLSKTLSVGRGLEWVNAPLEPKEPSPLEDIGKRADGYARYDTPLDAIDDKQWDLLQSRLKKPMDRLSITRASQDELHDKRRMVEALGGEMITFVPPQANKCFVPDSKIVPCLNFADPTRYPELYQRANRKDSGHLNQQGAVAFTRRLVEQIVALKSRQQ
jgi:hypothetical protein